MNFLVPTVLTGIFAKQAAMSLLKIVLSAATILFNDFPMVPVVTV